MKNKKSILICIIGILIIKLILDKWNRYFCNYQIKMMKEVNKYKMYYQLCLYWLQLKEEKGSITSFLINSKYNRVAIYGYGILGKILYSELIAQNVKVEYIIDQNAEKIEEDIPMISLEDEIPEVDVIIVTIVDEFENIKKKIQEMSNSKIVSLQEVIFNSYR